MDSCCPSSPAEPAAFHCPRSGTRSRAVDLLTVKALLSEPALRLVREGPYRFCPDPSCEVVYFDREGRLFFAADVRVPVWQKQPSGARTVCYCFGENEAAMAREWAETGRCDAARRVREHVAAGRCACEVRNPRGVCCLGDVMKAVADLEAAVPSSGQAAMVEGYRISEIAEEAGVGPDAMRRGERLGGPSHALDDSDR